MIDVGMRACVCAVEYLTVLVPVVSCVHELI